MSGSRPAREVDAQINKRQFLQANLNEVETKLFHHGWLLISFKKNSRYPPKPLPPYPPTPLPPPIATPLPPCPPDVAPVLTVGLVWTQRGVINSLSDGPRISSHTVTSGVTPRGVAFFVNKKVGVKRSNATRTGVPRTAAPVRPVDKKVPNLL